MTERPKYMCYFSNVFFQACWTRKTKPVKHMLFSLETLSTEFSLVNKPPWENLEGECKANEDQFKTSTAQ